MSFLENKVFWITGASSGIGEATALIAAQKGANLVLSARREEELQRVKTLTGLPDSKIMVLPMDVEQIDKFGELTQKVIDKFGKIDLLFNNAGISQRGNVIDTELDVYYKLFNVNLFGVIALTKAVLPFMIKQQSGHIIVTSSISGKIGTPKRSGYSASKHALHGFFDSLRSEIVKDKINVLVVCPGYINTSISENALKADGTKYGKKDSNQQQGLSAELCAKKIIDAIASNKTEVYMGGKEVLGVYLKRFFPRILNKILVNQIPK